MELGRQFSSATKVYYETVCLQAINSSKGKEKGCKKNANSGQQKDLSSHTAPTGILVLRYANIIALHLVRVKPSYSNTATGPVSLVLFSIVTPPHQAAAVSLGVTPSMEGLRNTHISTDKQP